jgi:hypothetical protein
MAIQINRESELCERLKVLGYANSSRIRLYGDEFDLTSNPFAEDTGYAVQAVSRKSGQVRKLRIPLSVLQMVNNDLKARRVA